MSYIMGHQDFKEFDFSSFTGSLIDQLSVEHAQPCDPESGRPCKRQRRGAPLSNVFCLEQMNDVLRRWDVQSGVIMWGSKTEFLFGYKVEEISGSVEWWRDSIHPDDRNRVVESINQCFEGVSQFWGDQYRFKISTGYYITIVDQLHIMRDELGKAVTAVGAMFNPLQRSQLDRLLDSSRLVRAQEAENHRRVLTEFIDYVCHEIRNPLHGIAASTEFLSTTFSDLEEALKSGSMDALKKALEEGKQHLESIRHCVDHQTLITNNVLDLSRFEAGKVELCDEVFVPCLLVNQTVNILRGKIIEKGIRVVGDFIDKVTSDVDITQYLVKGDATKIRQLLLNLVSNAIKFTPKNGEIEVRFESLVRTDSVATLTGSVRDTGVGMTPDEVWHVFQRFYQTNKKISSEYGGSGLGLNICDQIVKLMNGSIDVTSEKNVGSTFRFTVQLSNPTESEIQEYLNSHNYNSQISHDNSRPPTPTSSPPVKKTHSSRIESETQVIQRFKKVLVVEDNKINQKIVTKYLKKLGYDFSVANNGLEAVNMVIEAIRAHRESSEEVPFDFVLMDMEMPVMNGREATKRIRDFENSISTLALSHSLPPTPSSPSRSSTDILQHPVNSDRPKIRTPIVALSGNARKEKIKEALDCGVDDYLIKPCNLEGLEKMIQKWEVFVDKRNELNVSTVI
ncbi:hypothetical protein BKA69DRAFT_62693 [Paraphysoderma sedebokerense]|nr:hypothetical protein BKA69DRAFT_62693 [Paraphysoderma sedebokerense]